MARNPVVVALPPFDGVTRRIVLTTVVIFFAIWIIGAFSSSLASLLVDQTMLHPNKALGKEAWQIITYPFVMTGLLGVLLAALSLWFFGSSLEGERGSRWLNEYFFFSTIGGGLLACALSRSLLAHVPGFDPTQVATSGLWPVVLAMVLAFARFHADEEITFNFIFRLKAKYMAAIYVLIYMALTLTGGARFDALVALCTALCGLLYLQLAPRRGLRFAASEAWFGLRNSYIRTKRRRASKKFAVYMRKQGKEVHFDEEGKYISGDEEARRNGRRAHDSDPNDRRWMN